MSNVLWVYVALAGRLIGILRHWRMSHNWEALTIHIVDVAHRGLRTLCAHPPPHTQGYLGFPANTAAAGVKEANGQR
jgi:hypothetical protein